MSSHTDLGRSIKEASIRSLSDVFLLVDQACLNTSQLSSKEQEELKELNSRIKLYHQCYKRLIHDYPSRKKHHKFSFDDIVPRFSKILRDLLLTHQWSKALKWVHALSMEVSKTETTIWKAGLECLMQNGNRYMIQTFVKQVHRLKSLTCVEVLLDYLLYLLTLGDLVSAKDLILDFEHSNRKYRYAYSSERRKEARLLFQAYQGMVLYLEWIAITSCCNLEKSDDSDNDAMMTPGASKERQDMTTKSLAEQAIEYLLTVQDIPGAWDIFLFKVVEIYEYYDRVDDAREVLTSYREKNPNNPNAHRSLYQFEMRHNGDQELAFQCLQDLIKLDPCNPLAITLFKLSVQQPKTDNTGISILFDYLDFNHTKDDLLVWKLFAEQLTEIKQLTNKMLNKSVAECWSVRSSWWPSFILQCDSQVHLPSAMGDNISASFPLMNYKRIARDILFILEDKDEDYSPFRKKKRRRK